MHLCKSHYFYTFIVAGVMFIYNFTTSISWIVLLIWNILVGSILGLDSMSTNSSGLFAFLAQSCLYMFYALVNCGKVGNSLGHVPTSLSIIVGKH